MNEERMPINLFKLDMENGHEMTEEELKQQKKHDIQPWIFLICISVCAVIVLTFIVTKVIFM